MGDLITKESLFIEGADGQMVLSEDAVDSIRNTEILMKKLKKDYDKYKKAILDGMEAYGLKKVETDELVVTYVEPTERIGIDQDRLWAEHRDIAFECQKFSPVKASIRITVR